MVALIERLIGPPPNHANAVIARPDDDGRHPTSAIRSQHQLRLISTSNGWPAALASVGPNRREAGHGHQALHRLGKNYSSWSMRPGVLLKQTGIPFEEVKLRCRLLRGRLPVQALSAP